MDVGCAWGRSVGRLGGPLLSVAITKDDALVVGCTYGETLVWDAQDGRIRQRLPGASTVLLVPHDGERETHAVLAHLDVRLQPLDGEPARVLTGGRGPVAVSPDGRWLAARGHEGACVWNLDTKKRTSLPSGHHDPVCGLAFGGSAASPCLYVAYDFGAYASPRTSIDRFWLEEATRRDVIETGPLAYDAIVAASPDGRRIALSGDDGMRLIDDSANLIARLDLAAHAAAFSLDGTRLAMTTARSVVLCHGETGSSLGGIAGLSSNKHTALAFSRAGLVCDDDDGYRFVDVENGRFSSAAAGVVAPRRDAQALIEGLGLSALHEADYRTSATPTSGRQADGAWQLEIFEEGITLFARARDAELGALHLELAAFRHRPTHGWADAWADEHHLLAADVTWARDLLDVADDARLGLRRGTHKLGVEVTLDCAPPPTTLRRWLSALRLQLK